MPRFTKSVRVPYRPDEAFSLVSGIGQYPDFIKWITALRVSGLQETIPGRLECVGDVVVGFKGFIERFSTHVVADSNLRTVTASLIRGPFKRLHAIWTIVPLDRAGCDITLDIDYEFRNPLVAMLAAANHSLAVDRILNAFLVEAQARFGNGVSEPTERS